MIKKTLMLQKRKGETPLACMERFRSGNPNYIGLPMTYAGRLDPIATGELLVLVGDECKKKEEYLGLDKEYEATILFGFQTDSFDVLGLSESKDLIPKEEVARKLLEFVGKFSQTYPPYSSKTVNGKQLHEYARAGDIDSIELPTKNVEIYSIESIDFDHLTTDDLIKEVSETIQSVVGDFRQKETTRTWQELLQTETNHLIVQFKIKVSSGTYIRSIANNLGGTLLRLNRTKIFN
ncbi:MAG: tRNA pseudouridine(55) synthase [Candidatus Paceibacteria bacterium]|jgi:tRNA pseudouridine(55) synthase